MKRKICELVVLLLISTFFKMPSFSLIDYYKSNCQSVKNFESNISDNDRLISRSKLIGKGFSIANFINFINKNNSSPFFSDISQLSIPMILFLLLTFSSFLTFCFFLCCCDRLKKTNEKMTSLFFVFTIIFAILFFGLFVGTFVMLISTYQVFSSPVCEIAKIYVGLIAGSTYTNSTFIGLSNLQTLLTTFQTQIPNFLNLQNDFDVIYGANLQGYALPALQSLLVFSNTYLNSVTSDSNGGVTKPQSILKMSNYVNYEIFNEFNMVDQATNQITNAMFIGTKVNTQINGTALFSQAVQIFQTSFINFQLNLSGNLQSYLKLIINGLNFGSASFWVAIFLLFISLTLVGVTAMFVWFQNINKVDRCRLGAKILLILIAFVTFLLSFLCFYYVLMSITITSTCLTIPTVLNTIDLSSLLNSWGVVLDPAVNTIVANCIPKAASGNPYYLVNDTIGRNFDIIYYLDGVTHFNNLINFLQKNGTNSSGITNVIDYWTKISTGILIDQLPVTQTLVNLNNLTSCGKVSYQFNAINCTSGIPCSPIFQNSGFIPPNCCDASRANFLYNNLYSYLNDEWNLMSQMINDLAGSSISTPNSLETTAKLNCIQVSANFQNIKNQTGSFLTSLSSKGGFLNNLNCTIVRQNILNIEELLCFNVNNKLVTFTIVLVITILTLLAGSWTLCLALVTMEKFIENFKIQPDTSRNDSNARFLGKDNPDYDPEKELVY